MLTLLICSIGLQSNAVAVEIAAGSPAPFHGILMDIPTAQQVYTSTQKLYLLNKSYEDSIELYKKNELDYVSQVQILKADNTQLSTALVKEENSSGVIHIVYFVLGVITTGLTVYVFKK